ncbi:DNA-deoxyinosine glycosylase [Desulfosporosinus fructosivorans]|uniref:DNA-deoxyinosine glycosylase n=1 Tax=Desulfosporosinus fructosivorans TaxID=2018669 RepID=UPI0018EE7800|nr:DNA-deoxyinosine glycosylase [Desulfosporosinus fructosivorans]
MNLLTSFQPIIDERSRILILGSIPGVESLNSQQYYANPRNQFWKILYELFDSQASLDYAEKVSFIMSKQIGVWDVIENCYREGSLDSKIRDEKVNDFSGLFKEYPNIETVLFNGSKAYETYKRFIGFDVSSNLTFHKLTSSSPANTKRYEEKLREWSVIGDILKDQSHRSIMSYGDPPSN